VAKNCGGDTEENTGIENAVPQEHEELVDSQRSENSPKKTIWFGNVRLLFLFQGHKSKSCCSICIAVVSFKYLHYSCVFTVLINKADEKLYVHVLQ
jgi:hypothetical protein